jgi:UDP-N-acetylglucosamine---dolichyl-phosphate N-acetylglucosaminyltransferase
MSATIVVPAYNEEKRIVSLLKSIAAVGKYEIIVVDDGSSDRTSEVAKKYAKVVHLPENRGKGYACRAGVSAARYENIVFIDGDGQLSPKHIPSFLKALKDYDLVVGKRDMSNVPLQRRLSNRFARTLIGRITESVVEDGLCGLRAIGKKEFLSLNLKKDRYEFESEMLIKAAKNGLRITSIPIDVSYGGFSGMPPFQSLKVTAYLIREFLGA